MLFIISQGCSWRTVLERYRPWFTVHLRANRWAELGVLERVFALLQRDEIEAEPALVQIYLDSTILEVHQNGGVVPRPRGKRSVARAACPRLERGGG